MSAAATLRLEGHAAGATDGEPAIASTGSEGELLKHMHARVHPRWSDSLLDVAKASPPATSPIQDDPRQVTLALKLSSAGDLLSVQVSAGSGVPGFDAAALEVVREAAPFAPAPVELWSDDEQVYVRWTFARDERRCGALVLVRKGGAADKAVSRLLEADREAEAVRRVQERLAEAATDAAELFARRWLERALDDPNVRLVAAPALVATAAARLPDSLLRATLRSREHVRRAARALAGAPVSVCALVADGLTKTGASEQESAIAALGGGAEPACVPALIAAAVDSRLAPSIRAAALTALGTSDLPEARKTLRAFVADRRVTLRAAAIEAWARREEGRGAIAQLRRLLADAREEVRAAAAVGLVKIEGEGAVRSLGALEKERSPTALEAVARALGGLSGEASAQLLGKLAQARNRAIRVAAAAALAGRSDDAAVRTAALLARDSDADVRLFALGHMTSGERAAAIAAARSWDAFDALAQGPGRAAAASWLFSRFHALPRSERAELLARWLVASRISALVHAPR